MSTQHKISKYYDIIAKAIRYLADNREWQPSLKDLSSHIGLSEHHLQRVFSEWAGVTPKQFLQYLTKEYAKNKLRTETVMNAALSSGLSGSSRLHDLMIQCEGMTPGEYKNLGKGITIYYGTGATPLGSCFIATTNRGICMLAFFDNDNERKNIKETLYNQWSNALIINNNTKIKPFLKTIFEARNKKRPLKLFLKGSPFQLKVWEALLSIPEGATYQQIANSIEKPTAVRAVASAIAKNNIAYIIPCHRVIRQNGDFGQYRWRKERKQTLIAWEACKKIH